MAGEAVRLYLHLRLQANDGGRSQACPREGSPLRGVPGEPDGVRLWRLPLLRGENDTREPQHLHGRARL